MNISSLAALKRHLATKPNVTLVRWQVLGRDTQHKNIGVSRKVEEVDSVGFGLGGENGNISYCEWPKARDLVILNELVGTPAREKTIGFRVTYERASSLTYLFDKGEVT